MATERNITFNIGRTGYRIFESALSADGQSVTFKYEDDNGITYDGYTFGNSDRDLRESAITDILYLGASSQ